MTQTVRSAPGIVKLPTRRPESSVQASGTPSANTSAPLLSLTRTAAAGP